MRAVRLTAWQHEPEILDIPVPEPGPGQVLIKVAGAGVCHSDLHVMDWPEGALPYEIPFTLGHETAGWIEQTGAGVEGWSTGEAVAVYGPWGCGRCHRCAQGMENYCERAQEIGAAGGGLGRDGGMAEYMLLPSPRLLVPLGDLDPRTAAPLTDAGLTSYHAIKRSLHRLTPGSTALVIGIGGLGHVAVELLKALSPATVIAVDTAPGKLDLAKRLGADHTLPGDQDTESRVRDLTSGRGANLVLDFVGGQQTLALAAACASVLGEVAIVGLAGGDLPVGVGRLPFECPVSVPYWGSRPELMEVVALARQRRITPHVETFPLEQALEAYRRMREGELAGRAVLLPHPA
ncbi:NAD(P)-dependent alcohol dehydrogenase [Planobispora takensis]|uniref:alcohol dehydrogenase n=1 Tax=Planobispora takensis TaxID=1367882 RepID=A0A8J3WY87_9ACTN|nr:NAD(P)-dependent alcohol dehydrogenase [Planobispora takensis]GII03577.1 oxidoreductase [Planobispora takensis]